MFPVGPIFARSACTSVRKLNQYRIRFPSPVSGRWRLELYSTVDGADMLDESQQNKLKANINQLWLERTATSEIITAASELVRNMRGEAA